MSHTEVRREVIAAAEVIDRRIEEIPDAILDKILTIRPRTVIRAIHRREHIADIERAIGRTIAIAPPAASRNETADRERGASDEEAERVRIEVKMFIQQRPSVIAAFLTTLRRDGSPLTRPVATFTEGWTVGTISQGPQLKNGHIRRDPRVGYLFVERQMAPGMRPKNVYLQGTCTIDDDPAEVEAFLERRLARDGWGDAHPDDDYVRLLLRTTPTYVRAEGFLGPGKPAIYRTFDR